MEAIRSRLWSLLIIGIFVVLVILAQILIPFIGNSGVNFGFALRIVGVVVDILSATLIFLRLGGNRLKPLTKVDWVLILAFAIGTGLVICA